LFVSSVRISDLAPVSHSSAHTLSLSHILTLRLTLTNTTRVRALSLFSLLSISHDLYTPTPRQGFMAQSVECSMLNGFGVDGVRAFLNLVLLNLQRQHIEAQLTANRRELSLARQELDLISAEQNYEGFANCVWCVCVCVCVCMLFVFLFCFFRW
jgi:hypothetical protein